MENLVHLKCACGHCGAIFEYVPQGAGQIVSCPHCRQKSRLPEHALPNPAVPDGPLEKPLPICPDCGAVLASPSAICPPCVSRRGRNRLLLGLGLALVLLGAGWLALSALNRPLRRNPPNPRAVPAVLLPQPPVKLPKSIHDLKPGQFHLEPRRGNTPAYVTGDVQNVSDHLHLRVRIDLDLLDAQGVKIGVASDTLTVFQPRTHWDVLAPVTNPKAVAARFVSLKEDQ
jgi:hypothetical protein